MTPEGVVLGVVICTYGGAYGLFLPRMRHKTAQALRAADLKISAIILVIVAGLYFRTGTDFTLVFIETRWWVYTLVVSALIEIPFAIRFCRKWGISWADLGKF